MSEEILWQILAELKLIRARMSMDTACGFRSMNEECDHKWMRFNERSMTSLYSIDRCEKCGVTKNV